MRSPGLQTSKYISYLLTTFIPVPRAPAGCEYKLQLERNRKGIAIKIKSLCVSNRFNNPRISLILRAKPNLLQFFRFFRENVRVRHEPIFLFAKLGRKSLQVSPQPVFATYLECARKMIQFLVILNRRSEKCRFHVLAPLTGPLNSVAKQPETYCKRSQ